MSKFISLQIFTVSRLALAVLFFCLIVFMNPTNAVLIAAIIIALASELTDIYDGHFARKYSLVSTFGKYLDPYIDSLSRLTIYYSLALSGYAPIWLPIAMSYRDISVAYLRIYARESDIVVSARVSGKIKAIVQGVGIFIILFGILFSLGETIRYYIKYGVSCIVLAVTLWSLIDYFTGIRRTIREAGEVPGTK